MPPSRSTRSQLKQEGSHEASTSHASSPRMSELSSKRCLNIINVALGQRLMTPTCSSNYREELVSYASVSRLYVCDRCFKYSTEGVLMAAHKRFCEFGTSIPGRIIYDEERYSIYEVDGEEEPLFTQNLSLFAKLFIESKMVCFDVHGFLYYLLVAKTPDAHDHWGTNGSPKTKRRPKHSRPQIVGYYSKEKLSWDNHNLACILVFPPWQRLGLGQLLMKMSYEMGRREGRMGGPEKPLSTVGALSYYAFWSRTLATTLLAIPRYAKHKAPKQVSVKELSDETYIAPEDVTETLDKMGIVGLPRKKDGNLRLDKEALRNWCDAHGVEHDAFTLDGDFYEYSDDGDSTEEKTDDEDDDESEAEDEDDQMSGAE